VIDILLIDTAVTSASVCIARDGKLLIQQENHTQKDHASWIHSAIKEMMLAINSDLNKISAVAISNGPGSYTGLRVGLSAAKGICFATNKPLITINTLLMMAMAAKNCEGDLLCPMIDARRMEVFTAVYDKNLKEIVAPCNMILEETSFQSLLEKNTICFFGNGSEKFLKAYPHKNALLKQVFFSSADMINVVFEKFEHNDFQDIAYSEPFYGKDFYLASVKPPM
jgi:tRNA threonylcarbamoyladenosine biosynthesis protein TsaB